MTTTSNYTNNTNHTETTGEQLGAFLQAHHEIEYILPALVGMMITNRFQLRGATALLVNLTVAGFVREIIEQLKHQAINVPVVESSHTTTTTTAEYTTTVINEDSPAYTIVHSLPGRIRLRIPRIGSDRDYARRLEQLLMLDSHVLGVRINTSAASVIIHYQTEGMSDWELGMRLMTIIEEVESENREAGSGNGEHETGEE
ncbi:MAG: HMA2 domain-containing protein [Trichodesmium sp.]